MTCGGQMTKTKKPERIKMKQKEENIKIYRKYIFLENENNFDAPQTVYSIDVYIIQMKIQMRLVIDVIR